MSLVFLLLSFGFCVAIGLEDDFRWTPMEECRRTCDGVPKNCYIKMHIERYTSLGPACRRCEDGVKEDCLRPQCITADGVQRAVIVVNRQFPSPPIEVCVGDTLTVDVVNQMPEETTSIHWHGVRQIGTPYADGTPYVTQCPILPGSTFRHQFAADHAGTFFYHSHTATQKLDGLSGAFIVRDVKENEIYSSLYDEDLPQHVVFVVDWTHLPAEHMIPGLHNRKVKQDPVTFLINGKGKNMNPNNKADLPIAEFVVEHGKSYRFRLVGGVCMTCVAAVRIENHKLLAITTDGGLPIAPLEVDTIYLNSADRFDFILNATQAEGTYRFFVDGVGPSCDNVSQTGIIRYKNSVAPAPITPPTKLKGIVLNDIESDCRQNSSSELCVKDLQGTTDAPKITDPEMYHQLEIQFDYYTPSLDEIFKDGSYISYDEPSTNFITKLLINNMTFSAPPSPLISQFNDVPKEMLCSDDCMKGNTASHCSCPLLYAFPKNSVIDLIISDQDGSLAHPFHLHGFNFYIMEMGGNFDNLAESIEDVKERLRKDEVSTEKRPMKDTITVPIGGYAAVRFLADNPGYWILHCHLAFHLENGMAAVFKIGEDTDLPPVPENFPKCGNFLTNSLHKSSK